MDTERVRTFLRDMLGHEPTDAEISDVIRGYNDQQKWNYGMKAEISDAEYDAALESELADILEALDGKKKPLQ